MKEENHVATSAYFPASLLKQLDEWAEKKDRSRSWIITQAVINWIKIENEFEKKDSKK
jgi:predicted transcriptional regulator